MASPDIEALRQESERLLIQFLDRELELTQTLIDLSRIESRSGNAEHASEAADHARQGLAAIRKFIERVASDADRTRILRGLQHLETQAAGC